MASRGNQMRKRSVGSASDQFRFIPFLTSGPNIKLFFNDRVHLFEKYENRFVFDKLPRGTPRKRTPKYLDSLLADPIISGSSLSINND